MDTATLKLFAEQLSDNLNNNILPYWTERMTDPAGGSTAAATVSTPCIPMRQKGLF